MKSIDFHDINNTKKQIKEKYRQNPKITDREVPETYGAGYEKYMDRNEFSRDRDRISFSKAFRRLEHKAQVYSNKKGDHFRTRLTHTMEVVQISRSIARNLDLNEDLVESIALGHDIGHTPFGHEGEKALDMIMDGTDDLGGKLRYNLNYGGFKHNFNSLKFLGVLEKKYKNINGLNLTWQVMEGILKHTRIRKGDKEWHLFRFMEDSSQREFIEDLMFNNFSNTLEGQVVAVADEIAQRQHDIDDGLRDDHLKLKESAVIDHIFDIIDKERLKTVGKVINEMKHQRVKLTANVEGKMISIDDLYSDLKKKVDEGSSIEEIYKKLKEPIQIPNSNDNITMKPYFLKLYKNLGHENIILDELSEKIHEREKCRILTNKNLRRYFEEVILLTDLNESCMKKISSKLNELNKNQSKEVLREDEYRWNSLVRDVTDYFIKDVTLNSLSLIKADDCKSVQEVSNNKLIIKKNLISLSKTAEEINKSIKTWIDNRIVNSYDVNRFDGKSVFIVKQLFKAYYTNPRQMPKIFLKTLSKRIRENSQKYGCKIKFQNNYVGKIRFRTGSPEEIENLMKLIKLEMNKKEYKSLFVEFDEDKKSYFSFDLDEKFLKEISGKDCDMIKRKCEVCNKEEYERLLLSRIFKLVNSFDDNKLEEIRKKEPQEYYNKIRFVKTLIENHYAFMSVICDHISGMTDNFANNEYKKLYLV
jgi:dGTPase